MHPAIHAARNCALQISNLECWSAFFVPLASVERPRNSAFTTGEIAIHSGSHLLVSSAGSFGADLVVKPEMIC